MTAFWRRSLYHQSGNKIDWCTLFRSWTMDTLDRVWNAMVGCAGIRGEDLENVYYHTEMKEQYSTRSIISTFYPESYFCDKHREDLSQEACCIHFVPFGEFTSWNCEFPTTANQKVNNTKQDREHFQASRSTKPYQTSSQSRSFDKNYFPNSTPQDVICTFFLS